jgi:DNA polymerase elongation subunit (family B)
LVDFHQPSLILSFDRPPMGLDRVWIEQYRELVATRLRFKQRAADKRLPEAERSQAALFAESLKIIINSVYGKLSLKSSIVYDPLMGNQVTLRGQLYLIDLIEALVAAGGELLMGNTDGLLLDPAERWAHLPPAI